MSDVGLRSQPREASPSFPMATLDTLLQELDRVDRALDRADETLIVDRDQFRAYTGRLLNTRRQVRDRILALKADPS